MGRHVSGIIWVMLLMLFGHHAWAQPDDMTERLHALFSMDAGEERDAAANDILADDPDRTQLQAAFDSTTFSAPSETGLLLRETTCIDGVARPWILFIPEDYDPSQPTPLLVILHGGVSRTEIRSEPLESARENELVALAEREGMLAIAPMGQWGATWWDEVGMTNIHDLVRTVKRELNVDDDRVYMGGFSDGGSASFLHAMVAQTDYAAFLALNGDMGVGSYDGELHTYAPNFANTSVYAITTREDQLYPSESMRPTIELAQSAGADIVLHEYDGGHDFVYAQRELPLMADFLERHPRDPFPSVLTCEAAEAWLGQCRWLSIERVSFSDPEDWHSDFNLTMVDSVLVIGFIPGDDETGEGLPVDRVFDDTAAADSGLQAGDRIVRADSHTIDTIDDLNDWKQTVARGDAFELEVLREGERIVLQAEFAPPRPYLLFRRNQPSARVNAQVFGNQVEIEASRLVEFTIHIHPSMFALDEPLVVIVNGEVVHDEPIEPDVELMLNNFLENRDRAMAWVVEVAITIE